jgi:hypothetical protein
MENMSLNLSETCEESLENSIDAKKYSSWTSHFSILWLVAGIGILFKAAIEYHRDGRLASDFHLR